MKKKRALEQEIRQVLHCRYVGVLCTSGDDYPHPCLVAYAFQDDLTRILFSTSRTTRKYDNLKRDPRASLLVDTRTNSETDFHLASAVTAQGRIEELSGSESNSLGGLFLDRHPCLEEFFRSPTTALMGMDVSHYTIVNRFQHVVVLHMDHAPSR